MNFINNWQQEVALPLGATSLALSLPDGQYRLVLSDALGATATRWEIVDATVAGGSALLVRGREGTANQAWPDGSVIYSSVTAGVLDDLYAQIAAQAAGLATQAAALASLEARVAALENPVPEGAIRVGLHVGATAAGYYVDSGSPVGSVTPAALSIPGFGAAPIMNLFTFNSGANLVIAFEGSFSHSLIVSADVEGVGVLAVADASLITDTVGGVTVTGYQWATDASDWFTGGERLVQFTFSS